MGAISRPLPEDSIPKPRNPDRAAEGDSGRFGARDRPFEWAQIDQLWADAEEKIPHGGLLPPAIMDPPSDS